MPNPIWTGNSNGGLVSISIDGMEYTYAVDAAMVPKFKKQFDFRPYSAIRRLYDECR